MRNMFLIIAIACFFIWALGVCAFSCTGLIHVILVIAVLAFVLWLMSGDNNDKRYRNYQDEYHHEINH